MACGSFSIWTNRIRKFFGVLNVCVRYFNGISLFSSLYPFPKSSYQSISQQNIKNQKCIITQISKETILITLQSVSHCYVNLNSLCLMIKIYILAFMCSSEWIKLFVRTEIIFIAGLRSPRTSFFGTSRDHLAIASSAGFGDVVIYIKF